MSNLNIRNPFGGGPYQDERTPRLNAMLTPGSASQVCSDVDGAPAFAAPCKDAKTGKFTKCAPKAPAKAFRCKAANGKVAKCGTAGAKPI